MKGLKGFTLIELLVVIAVLGILAAVVLVAINPGERINEANDAGVKNDVGQAATALEACFTNNNGSYTSCTAGAAGTLVSGGYLKRWPATLTSTAPYDGGVNNGGTVVSSYGKLNAASAGCTRGSGSFKYWCYSSSDGLSIVLCRATAGVPNTACTG